MRVHFICRGNGLRSTMAEAYLRSLRLSDVDVVSTGAIANEFIAQGMPVSENALAVLRQHGIEQFAKRERTQLTPELLQPDDVVICMNQRVFDEAQAVVPLPKSTQIWHVADLGEGARVVHTEAEARAVVADMFDEIVRDVDDLLRALHLV